MSALKVGDVVRLASGGPEMTVIKADSGEASCAWFLKDDEGEWAGPLASDFPVEALVLLVVDAAKDS